MLEGRVTTEGVIEEATLVSGRERTVRDVLSTMDERGLLVSDDDEAYVPGPTPLESDRFDLDFEKASDGGAHRWESAV